PCATPITTLSLHDALPIFRHSRIRTPRPPLLLPLIRKSEPKDRLQILHNRRNHIVHLGIHRSNHRNTLRPVLLHDQSITITPIRDRKSPLLNSSHVSISYA